MKEIDNLSVAIENTRILREKFLADPYRPTYHFVFPEDYGIPGDPNGAFYANGRYHLMYLYSCRSDGFRWGHISSHDLLHWRSHPDMLMPDQLDGGIFSGGAFLDDDGTCYITYWALPPVEGENGGIRIAKSSDPLYEVWEKFDNYAVACTEPGVHETVDDEGNHEYLGCADPSNIWKKDGKYYMQMGNLTVLIKFKVFDFVEHTEEELANIVVPENIKGDWVELFESDDLINWKYKHRFYKRNASNEWTGEKEDDMCPSFLPLPKSKNGGEISDKYLQLFIAHSRGCQYYIGDYDKEKDLFYPNTHGRMTWVDNMFFAPEALIDGQNRQIMWSWLQEGERFTRLDDELPYGWSGVYGLPRTLWLREDQTLGIAPIAELEQLRYNTKTFGDISLGTEPFELTEINGTSCEIKFSAKLTGDGEVDLYVRANEDLSEYTKISYCKKEGVLRFDATKSGEKGRLVIEEAPLILAEDEELDITVFIDKSVIEVFANDRQAITRRVFPAGMNSDKVFVASKGNTVKNVIVHEISPTNFC